VQSRDRCQGGRRRAAVVRSLGPCPRRSVSKVDADVRKALADPTVKERLANTGNDALDMSAQEFAKLVRSVVDDRRGY
jgi:tripartite-type tricarboxylate transporter receptor subunit TctC